MMSHAFIQWYRPAGTPFNLEGLLLTLCVVDDMVQTKYPQIVRASHPGFDRPSGGRPAAELFGFCKPATIGTRHRPHVEPARS